MQEIIKNLELGHRTACIDYQVASGEGYRPSLVFNDPDEGIKVLTEIDDELSNCEEFSIGVAFITEGGLVPLLQTLKQLNDKGVKGRILTTNYLNFSEPSALERLHSLENITLKMYDVNSSGRGFHTKGYIFKRKELYRIIIGSSNLTQAAMSTNMEWNTRIVSSNQGQLALQVLTEFNELWNSEFSIEYEDFIDTYREHYRIVKNQRRIAAQENPISLLKYKLEPNSMQVEFISNLRNIIENNEQNERKKALLISATGTGKTYAAAFAMRELGYKRALFIVHRNQIAKQAKRSFENVFGNTVKTGYVAGIGDNETGFSADYVFATVQSLCSNENYRRFGKDYFDCCIFDESHHATAASYKKLFEYFEPKLSLGMTATPDKRDDNLEGHNVYELFDHNIALEIRLQRAMEERLLCPFHYFGIKDLDIIADSNGHKKEDGQSFRYLTSNERVRLVSQQAEYYGYSGNRVKGLIFCSRIEEAKELSKKFNELGYKTIALSGDTSERDRENAIDLLTREFDTTNVIKNKNGIKEYPGEDYYDYILTVDIFSEGVDIVEVNQVIMLRPTESPIVFIQQLGRGLRIAENKEYVVVLDFIANYRNNFMIPIALSGDRSYNKDNIRRYLMGGDKLIKGESTIHFDEISKKLIYEAIDNANFSDIKLICENYNNLKNKLGHIPRLMDFDEYGELDVQRIFDNKNLGSYYKFLVKYEKAYKVRLSDDEADYIKFISTKLANGKRPQELELLRIILDTAFYDEDVRLFDELCHKMKQQYGKLVNEQQKKNIINIFTNRFQTGSGKKNFGQCVFIEQNSVGDYSIAKDFKRLLENREFYKQVKELVDFGMSRYLRDYSDSYKATDFVLYQKYTYEDVCRLLNWENNVVSLNIGGYKYDDATKTFPVFINYEKGEDINASIRYQDRFISNNELIAISKGKRTRDSADVQNFLNAQERGIKVHLFVRKNKDDKISKEFYYLGEITNAEIASEFVMEGTDNNAVEIKWTLDKAIRDDLYQYITN